MFINNKEKITTIKQTDVNTSFLFDNEKNNETIHIIKEMTNKEDIPPKIFNNRITHNAPKLAPIKSKKYILLISLVWWVIARVINSPPKKKGMTDITQIRASLIKEAKVKKNVNFRFRIAINNNIKDKEKNIEAIVNCPNSFSFGRSEERRVGKEFRSRWSPYH